MLNTFFSHILKAHLHFTCSNKIFLLLRDIQVYHTFFSHLCIFHQRWNTFFTGYLFFLLHLFHPLQIIYLFFLIPFIPIPFFPDTLSYRPLYIVCQTHFGEVCPFIDWSPVFKDRKVTFRESWAHTEDFLQNSTATEGLFCRFKNSWFGKIQIDA